MKAFLALMRIDLKLALRNKAVLFFNYFFPLIFFFVFAQLFNAKQGAAINQVVTMVLAFGILGNGLFGAGMRAVMDREANVLRRYKVTPITPVPLLVASITTGDAAFPSRRRPHARARESLLRHDDAARISSRFSSSSAWARSLSAPSV